MPDLNIKKAVKDQAAEDASNIPAAIGNLSSKDSTGNKIARWSALGIGAGLDWDSTSRAIGTGGAKEGNPIVGDLANSRVKLGLVKGLTNGAIGYSLDQVAKKHPKLALATAIGLGGLQAGVGIRNYGIYNKMKK